MTKPGGANEGWNAPRRPMLLVHPNGLAAKATNEEIKISFEPAPDYAGIAKAAGGGGNPCNEGGEGCGARGDTQGGSGHGAGGHDDGNSAEGGQYAREAKHLVENP
ncbi:unnamed protein product [Clonostachys chloroleuca]|uniref:Uncharacterized protein n=1 Tax=Clonostachys chloroleuca TaxID=1926264 RepID=A0AA35M0G2_9HYPO|nr:unnamed protein product [Clonostachys chloroleuca]